MLGTAPAASPLVVKLEEWRRSLGMTHRAFAAHLGIHESYWSHLRHGKRPGGLHAQKLIDGVLRERPEFEFFVVEALRQRAAKRQAPA